MMICPKCSKEYMMKYWYDKHMSNCNTFTKNEKMSMKKKNGHKYEVEFMNLYCEYKNINYKSSSDCIIDVNNSICLRIQSLLRVNTYNVSLKSGMNIQFVLGKITELNIPDNIQWLNKKENCRFFFKKYLQKSHSDSPSSLLVYRDTDKWIFFNMNSIIDFIVTNIKWRKLVSGRIKGDFIDYSVKGISQYITYEFRKTHNQYFLGCNGNRGKPFIDLLMTNIDYFVEKI